MLYIPSPHEVLDVYDGVTKDARLLGRFTGNRMPEQITSTEAEVRLVLSANLGTSAEHVWAEIDAALVRRSLREAQHALGALVAEILRCVRLSTTPKLGSMSESTGWARHAARARRSSPRKS